MSIELKRLHTSTSDFEHLVKELNAYLSVTDGEEHDFYDQFNDLESLNNITIAYSDKIAVGCGAFRIYNNHQVEIKRMYTKPAFRGKGIAKQILKDLEKWALEEGFSGCILETGKRQTEAVAFYKNCGYQVIPNYDQYEGMENSLCFKKLIK